MTVRKYINILAGTFMVRLLPPWYANIGKRLVKNPKLYIVDSGIFHSLKSMKQHSIHKEMVTQIAKRLGPLRPKVAFPGGSATGFHISDSAEPEGLLIFAFWPLSRKQKIK